MKFNVVIEGDHRTVAAFINGELVQTTSANPRYDEIIQRLTEGDETVISLFDAEAEVSSRFEHLSDRVSVRNGRVYFDGDEVDNYLTQHLLRVLDEGGDFEPLVNFWENIAANPTQHSRDNLLRWLRAVGDFTITPEGMVIGYRGVDRELNSIHAGLGVVNGEEVNGNHSNQVGNVVSVPRSYVNHDPSVGCSYGLHVGTLEYASSFGTRVVKVLVNPRDVVSVPTDASDQKMRVCRYEVIEEVGKDYGGVKTAIDYSLDYSGAGTDDEDEDYLYDEDDYNSF